MNHYKKTFLMNQLLGSTNSEFRTQKLKSCRTSCLYNICSVNLFALNYLCQKKTYFQRGFYYFKIFSFIIIYKENL